MALAKGSTVTILIVAVTLKCVTGNFSTSEEAELISEMMTHLHCSSVIILSNESGPLARNIFLRKYFSHLLKMSAIWDFNTFNRKIFSDEISSPPKTLVVMEYSGRNMKELISVSKTMDLTGFDWLILTQLSRKNVRQAFEDVFIPVNVQFVVSTAKKENTIALYELYRISREGKLLKINFGNWASEKGLQNLNGDMFSRRMDLKGHEFKFAVHNLSDGFDPCESVQIDNGKQMIQCAYFDVWKDLALVLNYRTKYVVIEDCYQNGSMGISTPMLEMIRTGEADSGEDGYIWSSSRLRHNQFLWPLFHSKVILVTKIPSRKFSFSSYVRPFVRSMWLVLVGWLLLSGVVIVAIKHLAVRSGFLTCNEFLENIFMPLAAVCYQGSTSIPQKATIRLACLMIYLIPVPFIPSYSGSIISSLSVPSDNIPFNDLEEFQKDGTYKLAAINNTFFQFFLMLFQTDEQFEVVRQKKLVSTALTISYEQSFKDICSKKITFIFEWPLLSRYTINCEVFRFDLSLKKIFSSMAVRKNFPYLELFNRQMQKLIISGVNVKILEKNTLTLFKHEVNPFPQTYYQIKPFGFQDVLPLFAILFGGMCFSAILLVLERHRRIILNWATKVKVGYFLYTYLH